MSPTVFSLAIVLICLSGQTVLGNRDERDRQTNMMSREKRELRPDDRKVFADLRNKLTELEKKLDSRVCNGSQGTTGSTYTRWGRTSCQTKGTEMVYSGYTGGSWYLHKGAAVDYLCLPKNPDWDKYQDGKQGANGYVYGAEYEPKPNVGLDMSYDDQNVPCAVCRTEGRTSVLMVPGKTKCNKGWTKEYSGYLMSGYYNHEAASQYVCVDKKAEMTQSKSNYNGVLLYFVEAICGALPCPPYVNGRELTCVVCSK